MDNENSVDGFTTLIKILTVDGKKLVSAKELHTFLRIKTEFRKWFPRMCDYGFVENKDFTRVSQKCPTLGGEQEIVDYAINLEMAKELSMVQRTKRGKLARQYFIACEEKLSLIADSYLIEDPIERAKKWIEEQQEKSKLQIEKDRLQLTNATLKPKAKYYDSLVDRNMLTNFRDTAKEFGIKQSVFINWLLDNKYVYRDKLKALKPYSEYALTLFALKDFSNGNIASVQTLITPAGKELFRNKLSQKIISA